jgi:hypothetical protein
MMAKLLFVVLMQLLFVVVSMMVTTMVNDDGILFIGAAVVD